MKRRLLLFLCIGVLGVAAMGCGGAASTRGWAAPATADNDLVVSTSRGRLEGLEVAPATAWTARLTAALNSNTNKLSSNNLQGSGTPFQGDILRIGSEVIRVKSLEVKGNGERELELVRGFEGTEPASHAANAEVVAFRRPWRFPNDWNIPESSARSLSGIYGTPVVNADRSIVFVGDYNGYVYAFRPSQAELDAKDDDEQALAASVKLDGPIIGGLTPDAAFRYLYVTSGPSLYRLEVSQLIARIDNRDAPVQQTRLFETGGDIWGQPVVTGDRIFLSSLDGNLYAIDATSGRELWRFTGERSLASTPATTADTVFVGGFDRNLYAIDIATGTRKWSFQAADWVWSRPTIDGGLAYFGDFDGNLYAVNVGTGGLAWQLDFDMGAIRGAPVLARGMLVVASEEGWIAGIDPSTRAIRWEQDLPTAITADLVVAEDGSVLIAPAGCVTLTDRDDRVYYSSIDPLTGELRRAMGVCT